MMRKRWILEYLLTGVVGVAAAGAQPPTPAYDLLLKGGHVIDPRNGINALRDVAIAGDRIARVATDIPAAMAARVVDATGYFVIPGLIDIHAHIYHTNWDAAVLPETRTFSSGVTTVVDAGTAGWKNFVHFKETVIDRARIRVLAFLNIVGRGMGGDWEQDVAEMRPEPAATVAREYPGIIVGIKAAHFWTRLPWDEAHPPWACVDRAVQAGTLANIPVMVDFWPRPPERSYADLVLNHMRPGDIHTHVFAQQFPILQPDGTVNPLLQQAQQRGVILDVGHGAGSFWFRLAAPAIRQGFRPNTISTDLHTGNINGPVVDMITTMSKLLIMGVPLEEVIRMSTVAAAEVIRRPELGTLSEGAEADIAVFEERYGTFSYADCGRARMTGDRKLEARLTVRAGRIVYDPAGLSMPEWPDAPESYRRTPALQGQ